MSHNEFKCAQIRKLRGCAIIVFTAGSSKCMILTRIVVNRNQRIRIERFVNLFLRLPRTVLIFSRDMQHQRRT